MNRSPMPPRTTELASVVPLRRREPMKRTPLQATGFTVIIGGGDSAQVTPLRARTPRYTGPGDATRKLVLIRDNYACVCCGRSVIGQPYSLQHRVARGMGGTSDPAANSPENLLTMLGTGTTECHGRVESRIGRDDEEDDDHDKGYWLWRSESPLLVPVTIFSEHGSGTVKWLTGDGQYSDEPPAGSAA